MALFKNEGLISRLSVSRKLILIYMLDLSAVIFISTILINEKFIAIDFARKETVGNHYIAVLRDILFEVISTSPLNNPDQVVLNAEQQFGNKRGNLETSELSNSLVSELQGLRTNDPRIINSNKKVLSAAQALITRIGNQSNLILDPDLDSYYTMSLVVLRFPELMGLIAQIQEGMRAITFSSHSTHDKSRLQVEFLILEGRLDALSGSINSDYSEAIAAGKPELRALFEPSRQELVAAIDTLRNVVHPLAFKSIDTRDAANIEHVTLSLLKNLQQAWILTSNALDNLLNNRISELFNRMLFHLGTALALLLLILNVVYFVARQIAKPLMYLAKVAESVKFSGDYSMRAHWNSSDEIGRLVNAFNGMLEQLDRTRILEKDLAIQARTAEAQRELLEAISIPLMVTSVPDHKVLHTNASANIWLDGRQTDPWVTGLMPDARVRFFQQLADTGEANEFEALWYGISVHSWVLLSARRLNYQNQDAILTAFTPIGRLKQLEQRLKLWAKVFEASSESIMLTDHLRNIVTTNLAFCRSTAYEHADIIGKQPNFLYSDHHPNGFFDTVWQTAANRGSWQGEIWIKRKTGEVFPVWVIVNVVRDENVQITHYIFAALDITERKANESRINHLAHHDVLTDLPNRALCIERLRMALQHAERQNHRVAVLFIDLDRFKNINDSLGHHIGDGLLRSISLRLRESVRSSDTVCRLAGDEFIIILSSVTDTDEINQFVDRRLLPLIKLPHEVEGVELHISCSIGIAVYPEDGHEIDILIRNADAAMYQAKSQGRNNVEFFTIEMDRRAHERMMIESDLRLALDQDELRIYFQPRVDCKTGKLLGAEALIRWQHPLHGLVSPGRFIHVAEECGLIIPIGNWMIKSACRQQELWRKKGLDDIVVSINLSAAQLHDPELVETLQFALFSYDINPALIELELTESLLMEHVTATIELLDAIKALGILLSIDDFGTGYSSLNYLHRFPIDKLKIDQSFVRDMLVDVKDHAITNAIIGLGHTLGLCVVAEGVELKEEVDLLKTSGCDELQGYLFGKPMPAEEFEQWRTKYTSSN